MHGHSLSANVDEDTAAAIEKIARKTGVKKAALGGRALKFYCGLSKDVRRALVGIENAGTAQDMQFVMREIERVLALAHFRIVERQVVAELDPAIGGDGSDAAIDDATKHAFRS